MEVGLEKARASSNLVFDIVVLGAGVEGSSTAYQLSKMSPGKKIALVEQFSAIHSRGSSTGGSRITRKVYKEVFYTKMMEECFQMWAQLELEASREIYVPTGGLWFAPSSSSRRDSEQQSLQSQGVQHQVLTGEEANRRFPLLNLPKDYKAIFEEGAGILNPPQALMAFQGEFVKNGGVLMECCKVEKIVPGPSVKMYTSKGLITTKRLVITAGPWGPDLLKTIGVDLPLTVIRPDVFYWSVKDATLGSHKNFPVFFLYGEEERLKDVYGVPSFEYPGMIKICPHHGIDVHPDSRDVQPGPTRVEMVQQFISKHFSAQVSTTPSISEACIYTVSPDYAPFLDRHPVHRNIMMGVGFSGHGFKLAPVMGKILSELALDLPPSYDLAPFSISRFSSMNKL